MLVQNQLIKCDKGRKGSHKYFWGIILSVKTFLGIQWNRLMVTEKNISTMPTYDCINKGLHIKKCFYDYIIYSLTKKYYIHLNSWYYIYCES